MKNNIKNLKLISISIILLISIISHFLYEILPNPIFSILFPVNESIWEHMKLISTPTLIFSILKYFYLKNNNIYTNNYLLSYPISIIIGIALYLIIYLPIHYIIGHNLYISILLLIITFYIIETINYYLNNNKNIKYSNTIGIILIIFIYLIFTYLTYHPFKNNIFYDTTKKIYGIPKNTNN